MLQPDFIIIGAMKCATSTLQKQLALQPGIFMTSPKEPNFFSDDNIYANGIDWYASLYQDALKTDIKGEASTHYSKLPTYPETIARLKQYCSPPPRLIYVIRHPIERLVSHYMHEWSQGNISVDINQAIKTVPELIDYSRYHYQIAPYLEAFGRDQVLLVFYEQLSQAPSAQLARCAAFINYPHPTQWIESEARQNVSAQRLRKFPGYDLLINTPLLARIRRTLVPRFLRDNVKSRLTMKSRPQLSSESTRELTKIFNDDLSKLGQLIGADLRCDNFKQMATERNYDWL